MAKMTQEQMFEKARRDHAELMKDIGFLCGLYGDNPNPLTLEEIKKNAESGKSYSHAFQSIYEKRLKEMSYGELIEELNSQIPF